MKIKQMLKTAQSFVKRSALALAAIVLAQPTAQAVSYYLDTDGATSGFQATNGATYTLSGNYWNPDSSGIGTLAAFPSGGALTFGTAASDLNGLAFNVEFNNNASYGAIVINATNTTVTMTGADGSVSSDGSTWYVAAGSTLNQNNVYYVGAPGFNWQSKKVTLAGGGTINFNKMLGWNSTWTGGGPDSGIITENDAGAGLVVNLKAAANSDTSYTTGFTLTSGRLNFAAAVSSNAFRGFNQATKPFAINGGTLDN
ncbi:MAG: hypothetical protein WCK89_16400, partial [bacterium]